MIAALLSWTKIPQWGLELIVIAAVAGGVWYWQHERYEAGITAQIANDTAASQRLRLVTAQKTTELQTEANAASHAYEQEHAAAVAYRDAHPVEPVRLCLAANASRGFVPQAGAAHPGNASPGPAAPAVQPVPAGDSSGGPGAPGPDISALFSALASAADQVSAELREYQSRGP